MDLNENIISINKIIQSTKDFIHSNVENFKYINKYINDEHCLFVHIRYGDKNVEDNFINLILDLSFKYQHIIILSGLHLDTYFNKNDQKNKQFFEYNE